MISFQYFSWNVELITLAKRILMCLKIAELIYYNYRQMRHLRVKMRTRHLNLRHGTWNMGVPKMILLDPGWVPLSKEVGKQSSELRMTFIQVTLHHIAILHEGWYEILHHITIHHIKEGNERWCETLHHTSHNNTSHTRRARRVVTQGSEEEGWCRRVRAKGGDEGWWLREVVAQGSGD